MSELFPPRQRPAIEPPTVRLRCHRCDVAWSGPATSHCWVCNAAGAPLGTTPATTPEATISAFDLDLII